MTTRLQIINIVKKLSEILSFFHSQCHEHNMAVQYPAWISHNNHKILLTFFSPHKADIFIPCNATIVFRGCNSVHILYYILCWTNAWKLYIIPAKCRYAWSLSTCIIWFGSVPLCWNTWNNHRPDNLMCQRIGTLDRGGATVFDRDIIPYNVNPN